MYSGHNAHDKKTAGCFLFKPSIDGALKINNSTQALGAEIPLTLVPENGFVDQEFPSPGIPSQGPMS